ncbi:MAG: ABC transporter ATP-binding protein [Egibacteraceae bacterium]
MLGVAIRLQPAPFAVAVTGAVLYSLMIVAAAYVFGAVTDRLILPAFAAGVTTRAALAVAAAAIVGVSVVKAAGIVLRRVAAAAMQYRLQGIFRTRVTRQYQRLPLSWHQQHRTGELLSNANADVDATFAPIAVLPFAVGTAFLLVITAAVLIVTDPFLAVVGFALGAALAGLQIRYNTLVKPPATRAQQARAEVSSVAHESFDGAVTVKTLGREDEEAARFEQAAQRLRDELITTGRLRAVFDPLVESLPNIGVLVVLLVGTWRISLGDLAPGELVRVAYIFTLLAFPIRTIGFLLSELPRSVVGWERVQGVLTARDELPHGALEELPAPAPGARVDLVSVSFAHADTPVLSDVTVHAGPGRTIAVVGPTGAGKSTIAALLVRLADPDTGSVLLDALDIRMLTRPAVARQVAVVFQHSFLFDESVRDNITLGGSYSDGQVRAAAELAQAHAFITELPDGYETIVGERGATLSGGQRQRIALARALVRNPRLLVLDDATSSVDTTVERAILTGLRAAELPATVVVVASRRATIALADEVVFIERGRVRATGRHDVLLERHPAYAVLMGGAEPGHGP